MHLIPDPCQVSRALSSLSSSHRRYLHNLLLWCTQESNKLETLKFSMSKCIEWNSPAIQLFGKPKIRQKVKSRLMVRQWTGPLTSESIASSISKDDVVKKRTRCGISAISTHMEAFPTTTTLSIAVVAKPADPSVLLQISVVLISSYLIANFVVPQLLSKSLGFDKDNVDENNKPNQ